MKVSGKITSFNNMPAEKDDFLEWRDRNGEGFVLNEPKKEPFKLHLAPCRTLEDIHSDALRNPTHCSTDADALRRLAKAKGRRLETCPTCSP
jgi:hypothetical protein